MHDTRMNGIQIYKFIVNQPMSVVKILATKPYRQVTITIFL